MKNFTPPQTKQFESFKILPLSIDIAVEDYAIVMENQQFLEGVFGEENPWPQPTLTLRQNIRDLGWHEKEFQLSSTFAYNIRSNDDAYMGCLYVFPKPQNRAKVVIWTTKAIAENGEGSKIIKTLSEWVKGEWPFSSCNIFTHENKNNHN